MSTDAKTWMPKELDPTLYSLDEPEAAFFKFQTGITNDDQLKAHILNVQEKAYKVFKYPCIQRFAFTKLKISRLPAYDHFLRLGKERDGAIFLDIGCCFGNDTRKAIADGFPIENVIASDLRPEFWDLGHELFKSTPENFPVPFIAGDAFDTAFIIPKSVFYESPSTAIPSLPSLTSLTPLQGHISAIHASALFHLFKEDQQFELGQRLASLLSPQPGSIIFGAHVGGHEKGFRTEQKSHKGDYMFSHSANSWQELWDGQIFRKGTVKVEASLVASTQPGHYSHLLVWSVMRL